MCIVFCSDLTNESQEQYRTGTLLQSGAIAFCRYYNCLNEQLLVMLQTVLVLVWQTTMTNFLLLPDYQHASDPFTLHLL